MTNPESTSSHKNIVVFSDGTSQEGGVGPNTNVYKLFNLIEDRTDRQIAFYDRGIGTDWRKVTGNVGGAGISKNILDCYTFISNNYKWGDQIYLFGFSRGATTVRSLSNFLTLFGILPYSRPELIKKAYKIYRISDKKKRGIKASEFRMRNSTTFCNIKFLGVWDTVSALGAPFKLINSVLNRIPGFKHSYHDLDLSFIVKHAYQALAIDDERAIFHPEIWRTEKEGESVLRYTPVDPREFYPDISKTMETREELQTVKQVWFVGSHTDVGGGYKEQGVSNIPLVWMLTRAIDHGLKLYILSGVNMEEDVNDEIHDSRGTRMSKALYPKKRRSWDKEKGGMPSIHQTVIDRMNSSTKENKYKPWILEDFKETEYNIEPQDQMIMTLDIEYQYRDSYGQEA